jgi:hypothetical protein
MLPGAKITIYALLTNAAIAGGAFLIFPQLLANRPNLCLMLALFGCSAALATLFSFSISDASPGATFWMLIGHGAALIVLFAGIYRGFGLNYGGNVAGPVSGWHSLYFSVVTWTTLGYGDFTPPGAIRLVAAMQALLGYTFFGIIVGLGTDRLISRTIRR